MARASPVRHARNSIGAPDTAAVRVGAPIAAPRRSSSGSVPRSVRTASPRESPSVRVLVQGAHGCCDVRVRTTSPAQACPPNPIGRISLHDHISRVPSPHRHHRKDIQVNGTDRQKVESNGLYLKRSFSEPAQEPAPEPPQTPGQEKSGSPFIWHRSGTPQRSRSGSNSPFAAAPVPEAPAQLCKDAYDLKSLRPVGSPEKSSRIEHSPSRRTSSPAILLGPRSTPRAQVRVCRPPRPMGAHEDSPPSEQYASPKPSAAGLRHAQGSNSPSRHTDRPIVTSSPRAPTRCISPKPDIRGSPMRPQRETDGKSASPAPAHRLLPQGTPRRTRSPVQPSPLPSPRRSPSSRDSPSNQHVRGSSPFQMAKGSPDPKPSQELQCDNNGARGPPRHLLPWLEDVLRPQRNQPPKTKRCPNECIDGASIPYEEINFGDPIGAGSFGAVYKGTARGTTVAIKQCKIGDEHDAKMLLKEICYLQQLRHERLVSFLYFCNRPPHILLLMEFMPGGSLHQLLFGKKKRLPFDVKARMGWQMSEGLIYLHGLNVVHRDLKTMNIVLDLELNCKICDFGLTITLEKTHLTVKSLQGSPRYMAPEQFESDAKINEKVDIWQMGCVMLEMFCLEVPFKNCTSVPQIISELVMKKSPPTIPRDADPRARALIQACFRILPERRPAAKQLEQALHWVWQMDPKKATC